MFYTMRFLAVMLQLVIHTGFVECPQSEGWLTSDAFKGSFYSGKKIRNTLPKSIDSKFHYEKVTNYVEHIRGNDVCSLITSKGFERENDANMRERIQERWDRKAPLSNPLANLDDLCPSEVSGSIKLKWTSLYHRFGLRVLDAHSRKESWTRAKSEILRLYDEYDPGWLSKEVWLRHILGSLRDIARDTAVDLVGLFLSPDSDKIRGKLLTAPVPRELANNEMMLKAIAKEHINVLLEGVHLCRVSPCRANAPKWLVRVIGGITAAGFFIRDSENGVKEYHINESIDSPAQWKGVGRVIALSLIEGIPLGIKFVPDVYDILLHPLCPEESKSPQSSHMCQGFHEVIPSNTLNPYRENMNAEFKDKVKLNSKDLETILYGLEITAEIVVPRLEFRQFRMGANSKRRKWLVEMLNDNKLPDFPAKFFYYLTQMKNAPLCGPVVNDLVIESTSSGKSFENAYTSSALGIKILKIPTSFKDETKFKEEFKSYIDKAVQASPIE